jgi:hypothetical protein
MKLLLAPLAAFALLTNLARGQELPGESPSLIPEMPAPATKPRAAARSVPQKSSTERTADDLQARIRFRDVKTKALQDPKFQIAWDSAQAARTDPEKRVALKDYYKQLYDRMVRIDPRVKPRVEMARKLIPLRFEPRGFKAAEDFDSDEETRNLRGY